MLVLSEKIKLIRKESGLNTTDFGAKIGVSGRTVEDWEQGRRNPSSPALLMIEQKFIKKGAYSCRSDRL